MRIANLIKKLTVILLLCFTASGIVSAKVASGSENLNSGQHQAEYLPDPLLHLGWDGFSYDEALGSSVVTKGIDSTLSRSGAFKAAKQKAGVPRNQQPDKTYREKIRDQEGHVEGRVYEFKRQDGSTATIREHSLGHKLDNHGPHFNSEVRDSNGIKQPLGGNGDSHTYFNR